MFRTLLGAIAIFFVFAGMTVGASATSWSSEMLHSTDATQLTFIGTSPILPCDALCIDQAEAEELVERVAELCGGSARCSFECDDGELERVRCDCIE